MVKKKSISKIFNLKRAANNARLRCVII